MTKKDRISFYIDADMKKQVENEADRIGITVSGFLNVVVSNYFKEQQALNLLEMIQKATNIDIEKLSRVTQSDVGKD